MEDLTTAAIVLVDNDDGTYTIQVFPRAIGTVVVHVRLHGTALPQSPVVIDVVSPLCDSASMQLDDSRTQCVCKAGFEVPSGTLAQGLGNGTKVESCTPCRHGFMSSTAQLSTCTHCNDNEFSYAGATSCQRCPAEGAVCVDGVIAPLNGYWVEDAAQVPSGLALD